jgi:hypothetical protein
MPATHDISAIEDVFSIWNSDAEMFRDVGVPYDRGAKWAQRLRIPPEAFPAVIEAAERKGVNLSIELLTRLNTPRGTAKVVG